MNDELPPVRVIENLDDFNNWINYAKKYYLPSWPQSKQDYILEKIEKLNIKTYDEPLIQELVTEVNRIIAQRVDNVDRSICNSQDNFIENAREFRYDCEKEYGEQAYEKLLKNFDQSLNELEIIPDNDQGKATLIRNLNNAKYYIQAKNDKQAWIELYRFWSNINDGNNKLYLNGKIQSKRQSEKSKKERKPAINIIYKRLSKHKNNGVDTKDLWLDFITALENDLYIHSVEHTQSNPHNIKTATVTYEWESKRLCLMTGKVNYESFSKKLREEAKKLKEETLSKINK